LVLVSEMTAGWYRYICEWRLHRDGTIRPRFRFGATANSCVCHAHNHHCYWRFDFDLQGATNLVEEFNRAPGGSTSWRVLRAETKRLRDPSRERRWRVRSTSTPGLSYEIVPGPNDGTADAYGRGDVWVLRFRQNEIDDGIDMTTGPRTAAELDRFVNREVVERQDVVVWYAGHFLHDHEDPAHEGAADCGEVGPTLRWVERAPASRPGARGSRPRGRGTRRSR
jgi:Cu2+-containing amine oxidase